VPMERDSTAVRGIAHPMHPAVLGSVIGMAGASVFMLVNRDALPGPWPLVALLAWAALLAAAVWAVFLAPRRVHDVGAPSRWAGPTYGASVLGMVALIVVGTRLARQVGVDSAQPAVVAAAVGLHFIPFAWAFRARAFAWMGGVVAALGLLGVLAAALLGTPSGEAAAVLAGAAMLAFLTVDERRPAPTRSAGADPR